MIGYFLPAIAVRLATEKSDADGVNVC